MRAGDGAAALSDFAGINGAITELGFLGPRRDQSPAYWLDHATTSFLVMHHDEQALSGSGVVPSRMVGRRPGDQRAELAFDLPELSELRGSAAHGFPSCPHRVM